jgi:hypothetical protein
MIAHPLQNGSEWGRVLIGGSVFPGILTSMTVPPRVWEWATQNGYGQTKVTIYRSTGVLDKISFTHWLNLKTTGADDWNALCTQFVPTLIPGWPTKYAGKPRSMQLVHPAVQFLGAKRAHMVELHAPEPPSGEKIPQFYTIVWGEDVPQTIIKPGVAEPAVIKGPPKPQDLADLALYSFAAQFSGQSVEQYLASPASPTNMPATATGSVQ